MPHLLNRWHLPAAFAPLVVGVVLATVAANVQDTFLTRRTRTCNGLLPMPASGFVFAWAGSILGLAALALVALLLHHRGVLGIWSRFATALLGVAVLVLLFESLVLRSTFGWAGSILGLAALALVALLLRRERRRLRQEVLGVWSRFATALLGVAVVAFLFEVVVLYTTYREAAPIPILCSG